MVNINGKEWSALAPIDIKTVIDEQDFDESFYFECAKMCIHLLWGRYSQKR